MPAVRDCTIKRLCMQIDLRPLGGTVAQAREATSRWGGTISPSLGQLYEALGRQPCADAQAEAEALVASVAAGADVPTSVAVA